MVLAVQTSKEAILLSMRSADLPSEYDDVKLVSICDICLRYMYNPVCTVHTRVHTGTLQAAHVFAVCLRACVQGLMAEDDLPLSYVTSQRVVGRSYGECLDQSRAWNNDRSVDILATSLGLSSVTPPPPSLTRRLKQWVLA